MSFITKRERVFNEYELFDLPARNEGKLKAYASCTDARAWSHFCSDKTEHLVEIIKRNNETCRPKYVPTNVIVDTIMVAKNAEIARLKRKIEEFEQMLAAYDQLDLDCNQKCEIANAHAAIKAANKELDELCLDLDISGYTEGIDSEAFETGKSRGDEPVRYKLDDETPKSTPQTNEISYELETTFPKMDSVGVQKDKDLWVCDASTNIAAEDPRIEEMQEVIIAKDAKLGAMKNTIAVMENDVCEPYCIYAHIYTALEKIFGVLCQNEKYKHYLNLLTAGKDTRCIDIKGKILYKMKVLEKFCVALIAPCSQDFTKTYSPQGACACYRAEVSSRVESTYALTSPETKLSKPNLDNKRAQLVADIIKNDEIKEILSKENSVMKQDDDQIDFTMEIDNYSIDTENLKRLKNLQENYDDLMICYESLKHEKDCLDIRCYKYEDMEKEFESMKSQMREYNSLWNEKEYYQRRSAELDALKEQYLILADETLNMETQLKAETEINYIKCKSIEELRNENILLEKKINELSIEFEKEKNALLCKLKEADCRIMCQDQQIKSLSLQIDKLLEQDYDKNQMHDVETHSIALIDEIESLKEQIKNLKDAIFCNEEEKQQLHIDFQDKLKLINQLRMEVEDWKNAAEKNLHRNDYLEKCTESFRDERDRLIDENKLLSQDVEEKTTAVENLIKVINNKSEEINKLVEEVDKRTKENEVLFKQFLELQELHNREIISLGNENKQALKSLQVARQESQELLEKVKDYDDVIHKKQDVSQSLETQIKDNKELKDLLKNKIEENNTLKNDIVTQENNNSILLQEIQKMRDINTYAVESLSSLHEDRKQYKISMELAKKESGVLKERLSNFENLTQQLRNLQISYEKLNEEKRRLENELYEKSCELDNAQHYIKLSKKESLELIGKLQQSEQLAVDILNLNHDYQQLDNEKHGLEKDLTQKMKEIESLQQSLNNLNHQNDHLLRKCELVDDFEQKLRSLNKAYDDLLLEKNMLQNDFDSKTEEFNNLYNTLESKKEENKELLKQLKSMEMHQLMAKDNIKTLENKQITTSAALETMKRESADLIDKIKHYERLQSDFDKLKESHDQMKKEKEKLQTKLDIQTGDLRKMKQEDRDLNSENQVLLTHSEELENALINTRTELILKSKYPEVPYEDVMKEIEDMKREIVSNHEKIRELFNKLDESENIISDLSEDVLARDDRIAVLENYINELEDEVKILHNNLAKAVDTGEQIRDHSYEKIDKSLKTMEAHHSRATHNMKMELAKLQHQKTRLEEQLSTTRLKSEESLQDKHKYVSQIIHLKNEREIIVTDIKQLELKSVGDSALSPDRCEVEDILTSLDRIRKCLDARYSKSTSLEQTLFKVQTSSQLLLSKADEAKKLVEKEKQKIINEKEEAIRDRHNMEKQLVDLKEKLKLQSSTDKSVIKDLEAEILNQKLIIDKINKSTQDYISKLKEEMQSLKDLYENSAKKICELQETNQTISEENKIYTDTLKRASADLTEKSKEIENLQKVLDQLKRKENRDVSAQAPISEILRNMGSQTDRDQLYHEKMDYVDDGMFEADNKNSAGLENNITMLRINKPTSDKRYAELTTKQKQSTLNEVQILTANVEPTFDYVRNSYLNYKIKRLRPGKLEHYSISCPSENELQDLSDLSVNLLNQTPVMSKIQKLNFIDIYKKDSIHINSSKGNDQIETASRITEQDIQIKVNTQDINEFYKTDELFEESTSDKSTEKDLFIIYKDSVSDNKKFENNRQWPGNAHSEIIIETLTIHSTDKENQINQKVPKQTANTEPATYLEDEDDTVKTKLKISLPRVENGTSSLVTTASDGDEKSVDSYTIRIYPVFKNSLSRSVDKINSDIDSTQVKLDTPSLPTVSNDDAERYSTFKKVMKPNTPVGLASHTKEKPKLSLSTEKNENESRHKLFRVGADVFLLKTEPDNIIKRSIDTNNGPAFGFEYIMGSMQREVNPEIHKYCATKKLRLIKSDDRFDGIKDKSDYIPSGLSTLKCSSTEYKTISTVSKLSDKSQQKCYVDRNVMAKLDRSEEYETKIKYLTRTLETIEKDYKKKIDAIKVQYDNNIKSIINEHNQGVQSIQGLHEEALHDIIKIHENEVENLRSMSIEAMRKADKLERENRALKTKTRVDSSTCLDEEPVKISTTESKKRKRCRGDAKMLTKTTVEAFNVKPKIRSLGPCTCSLDVNLSDTIRNIFEQVDVEQRKMTEHTYMKYIANKILSGNIEILDAQELSFLHLKVCRIWKSKLSKEEALQKRIDSLEIELMNKQRHAQKHIADLDRKVAEERRRLQEVREAVCRSGTPAESRGCSSGSQDNLVPPPPNTAVEKVLIGSCHCDGNTANCNNAVGKRRSAGDIAATLSSGCSTRCRRPRTETSRAVLAKLDREERREKKLYNDEPPTRLRRSHERQPLRPQKK